MTELVRQSQHIKGLVRELFALDTVLASTRSADLYKAIDLERDQPVLLWMLRDPLPLHSTVAEKFLAHVKSFQRVQAVGEHILFFGMDGAGYGFVVLPPLDGQPLAFAEKSGGRASMSEPERRFTSCVKLVEQCHREGIICGDLSHSSFWVNRDGDVQLIGVLGAYDSEIVNRTGLPPVQSIHFIAPEQGESALTKACDVFALGVLGYYLFTGHFPYGDDPTVTTEWLIEKIPALTTHGQFAPLWADALLRQCLVADPDLRFPDAPTLQRGIGEARANAIDQAEMPTKRTSDAIVAPKAAKLGKTGLSRGPSVSQTRPAAPAPKKTSPFVRLRLVVAVFAVFVISLVVASQVTSRKGSESEEVPQDLALHRAAAAGNPDMQRAIAALPVSQQELAEAANRFEALVASDDPLAHVVLVKSALEAKTIEVRNLAERALVDRVRRLGMLRSAEQLRQWLRTIPSGAALPPTYEPLLKSLNATLPVEAREAELRKAYVSDPRVTLRVAASLALDSSKVEEYQSLLSQLVGDALSMDVASQHSALALMLAHPELAVIFGDDVVQKRAELPDGDVTWLLGLLGNRNDFYVRPFASLAVERGLLPPLRRFYLTVISEQGDALPPDVMNALVRASAGALLVDKKTGANDIASIGQWENRASVRILLVICADTTDPALLTEAFDTLAAKSVAEQPAAGLIEWVRKSHWDTRAMFAHAIGTVGVLDLLPPGQAQDAFIAFEPHLKDSRLVNLLLGTKDEQITKVMLEKYASSFDLGTLLSLLRHDSAEVRKLVVPALGRYNDIGAIKLILDRFEQESDEGVRQLYRETFWFVREREASKQNAKQ